MRTTRACSRPVLLGHGEPAGLIVLLMVGDGRLFDRVAVHASRTPTDKTSGRRHFQSGFVPSFWDIVQCIADILYGSLQSEGCCFRIRRKENAFRGGDHASQTILPLVVEKGIAWSRR